nr:hypothetical protein GCM10025732_57800 [Glycomyces mayteni]
MCLVVPDFAQIDRFKAGDEGIAVHRSRLASPTELDMVRQEAALESTQRPSAQSCSEGCTESADTLTSFM